MDVMTDAELEERLENALNSLLPLFDVSKDELSKFRPYSLIRELGENELPRHPRNVPGYGFEDNRIYFPRHPEKMLYQFSDWAISHEVGHHIHNMINPMHQLVIKYWREQGSIPDGWHDLVELVACYGAFSLGMFPSIGKEYVGGFYAVYNKFGPGFLPCLSRLSLDEAIFLKIISTPKTD